MKKHLENNRIYFEVFAYVLLGSASIIVAYLSWLTSEKQLDYLIKDHQPIINLKRDFKGDFEIITIENVGHHLHNQKIEVNSFYESSTINDTSYFKIYDYFDLIIRTHNTKNTIGILYSSDYSLKENKRIAHEAYNHPDFLKTQLSLNHIVKVSFKNESDNTITKHFIIDPFNIIEIPENKHKEIYKNIENAMIEGKDGSIKKINFTDIL